MYFVGWRVEVERLADMLPGQGISHGHSIMFDAQQNHRHIWPGVSYGFDFETLTPTLFEGP